MQNKVTDKNNYRLSNDAYDISDEIIKKGGKSRDKKFKVLDVENNKNNGMQAMAVAQVRSRYKINRDFKT